MNVSVDVKVEERGDSSLATVRVVQDGNRTQHVVTVMPEDLERYGATDVGDLVHRSFVFLLGREANTSIQREFRITDIERYFPEYPKAITARSKAKR